MINGLQNIYVADGFTITFLGIGIVFFSLFSLALSVEIFHKVLFFWENKHILIPKALRKSDVKILVEENFADKVKQFMMFVKNSDEISLPRFLKSAKSRGLTYFYPVVAKMAAEKYIEPNDRGFFILNREKCNKLIKGVNRDE